MIAPKDKVLIQACLQNNTQAQTELYDRFNAKMFGLCMRYARNEAEAEDFLLEGFYKVFRDLHQYNFQSPLEGWIKKVMINTALMTLRKKQILDFREDNLEVIAPTTPPKIWQRLDTETILLAIQQLPRGYQIVFNLYAIEGYTHQEIGEQLGISASTSRSQYTRARQALQHLLLAQKVV